MVAVAAADAASGEWPGLSGAAADAGAAPSSAPASAARAPAARARMRDFVAVRATAKEPASRGRVAPTLDARTHARAWLAHQLAITVRVMGKVVQLDGPDGKARVSRVRRRSRRGGAKTALVLGGGGFTGGVYEIGALRAFDLLAVNRTVNEFDVYVGTSAGSFVASMVANGVTPEEMMRVLNKALPSPIQDPALRTLLRPNYRGFVGRGGEAASSPGGDPAASRYAHRRDLADGRGDGGRRGAAAGHLPQPRDRALHARGCSPTPTAPTTSASCFERELLITATDVDTAERIVLGQGEWEDVPISRAVAASTALPLIYEPLRSSGAAS